MFYENMFKMDQSRSKQFLCSHYNLTILKMGVILQRCEDPALSEARLNFAVNSNYFNHSDYRTYFQQSRMQLFGDIFYKQQTDSIEFVLQTHMTNRATEVLNHSLKVYPDSNSFMQEKGSKLKIITSIEDPNFLGRHLFLVRIQGMPKELVAQLIPFNRYEDEKFKKGLYEVAMLHSNLRQQNNRYGFVYQDAFVIESGIQKDHNDKCLAIIGDFSNATLNEIITYRRMSKIAWTQSQFQTLAYQLIRGVAEMHKTKLFHRDIRPHNVFYSAQKKSYILGGFANALDLSKANFNLGMNLAGVPYYLPERLASLGKKQDFSEYHNYDPEQLDIYSLGLTLLNTLFLNQYMPPQTLKQSAMKYESRYKLLQIIMEMLEPNPPNLMKILEEFPHDMELRKLDEKNQIQAYRFKTKPHDQQFVAKKKLTASGYYQMFMYDDWVDEINEVVNYYELNRNSLQLANIYQQIAEIYYEHHQEQLAIQYYRRVSSICLQLSDQCLRENNTDESIKFLERGIDCNRIGYKSQPNPDLANFLNKLAMINHINQEYQIARAFQEQALDIIGKVNGNVSSQYAQMLADAAKIQMQFKQFKIAEKMLKEGLRIIDRKQPLKQNQIIKAKLLETLGNNFRYKSIIKSNKSELYHKKSEQCLLDALDTIQRVQGSIHSHIGSILMNLGNLYFDRRQFDKAKKSYQKSLIVKQYSNKGSQTIEVGQCLTYLANTEKFLKEYDKAIKHYDEAIQIFRRAYGNDHNQNTAIAIGNMGLLYRQMGRRNEQKQYLNLAKGILKDISGQFSPDYQYFDKQLRM